MKNQEGCSCVHLCSNFYRNQNVNRNSEISYNGIEIYDMDRKSYLKLFCSGKVWIGM